ncbi:MAG: acyl carrier protein [Gammaproteobacteria bacterium]
MDINNVYPKVAEIVADVLAVDESEVTPESSLMGDLGAESIDFLDLVFRLERGFGIKIPRGQIEKEARGTLSESEFEKDCVITPAGIAVLKQFLSEVPEQRFKENLKLNEIPTLFTVTTLCKLVLNAQARQGETAGTAA